MHVRGAARSQPFDASFFDDLERLVRTFLSRIEGLKRRYFKPEFDRVCRSVLRTPPVVLDESSGLVVLSQSYHKDLYLYLVAAKTFARHIRPARFVVVDDGYTAEDQAIIRAHLQKVEFIPRKGVTSPDCPVGGCWERLLSIADLCADDYVIQLDSDTVTVADPVEVRDCINRNASFTLPTKLGQRFVPVSQAAADMERNESQHIQVLAERALGRIPEVEGTAYIRGCAGFAGFAKGSIHRKAVEQISRLMMRELGGDVWKRWGSEQFASNYLIANTPLKAVLPFAAYPYWEPGADLRPARLVHFIGDHRFTSSTYRRVAMKAVHQHTA